MTREYLLSLPHDLKLELGNRFGSDAGDSTASYLVANIRAANALIYAPEINFYLRCSEDEPQVKMDNVERLFDIRATAFDHAQDIPFSITVNNSVAVIGSDDPDGLAEKLAERGLSPTFVDPAELIDVRNAIGNFRCITTSRTNGTRVIEAGQIIWFGAPDRYNRKKGVCDPTVIGLDISLNTLCDHVGLLQLRKTKRYDQKICLLHNKRHDICGRCADICPSAAITRAGQGNSLLFSDADCSHCGQCTAICPSGALASTVLPDYSFEKIASFFAGKTPLIVSAEIDLESFQVQLPPGLLPLVLEQPDCLHENHLLILVQSSGRPVVIYSNSLAPPTANAVRLINDIYAAVHRTPVVHHCRTEEELQGLLDWLPSADLERQTITEPSGMKRKQIATRLASLVGNRAFGTITTGPLLHYGNLRIDRTACTLCLSCADACSVGALVPFADDNTLRFNPSLCTNCGYCAKTCPEPECLQTIDDRLELEPGFFSFRVMAADTISHCAECGAAIGPSKAIEKITAVMTPLFAGDPVRLKTLSCCSDCKAKLMIAALRPELMQSGRNHGI